MLWLHRLFHHRDAEQHLDAELRFHLEQRANDYVALGLSPEEARRQANLAFGGLEQVKQDCREVHFENGIEDLARDFRCAFRSLTNDRRFTLVAILALALGIGATTVMFSIIYNVVFDPFPYRDFQHAVEFDVHDLTAGSDAFFRFHYTIPEFLAIREQNHVFEDMVANYQLDVLYNDGKGTRRFLGGYVTANGFEFLGVSPLLGRYFSADDVKPGAPLVFMMNYQLWRTEFSGDPTVLGRSFFLNGKSRKLVGIMPQRFNGYGSSLWFPLALTPGSDGTSFLAPNPAVLWALARLKKGVSVQEAGANVDVILHQLAQANPGELYPQRFKVVVRTLLDFVVGDFRRTLYALLGAVFLLLLIACSNVGNLLLTRATIREREIAVRASLGASRGRLIRQLLVESFVLATVACVAGCLLAYLGLKALVPIIPRGPIPEETVIALNPAALLFAMAISALATLICGLMPALHAVRRDLRQATVGCAKSPGGGFRYGNLRAALVIAEVALSMVLLTGAAFMMRSFFALTHVDFSFDPTHMLYAQVMSSPSGHFDTSPQKKLFYEQVLASVAALPGVVNATETISLPPLDGAGSDITLPGTINSQQQMSMVELCDKSYFRTLGLRLVLGRLLSQDDMDSVRHVAIVNQAFVRAYFGNQSPLQQKVKFNVFDELPDTPRDAYFEIIGVVADFKNKGLLEPATPQAFLPHSITTAGDRFILATTSGDPKSLVPRVERAIWDLDPNVAVTMSGSVKDLMAKEAYVKPQFGTIATGAFAATGLVLVLVGIFSVMAYSVTLQTHQIGVRMALGAQQRDVLTMILWQGLRLVSIGILIGLLASLGVTRFLASQLPGVSATDPLTFSAVLLLFLATSLIACLLPARRATRLDPLLALRYE